MSFKIFYESAIKVLKGSDVETGKAITINYLKNPEKAPYVGSTYGQDVEPSGFYFIQQETNVEPKGWKTGKITFKNPLVIDTKKDLVKWKYDLSKEYKATKKNLTKKLLKKGYDGIITVHNNELGEMIYFGDSK